MSSSAIEISKEVKQLLRQLSLSKLKVYSKLEALSLDETTTKDSKFFSGHWMALILISARPLKVTFKTHYMTSAAKVFASSVYKMPIELISNAQAADFIKEFCNLSAGALKKIFEDQQTPSGISLPMMTRSFDDLFSEQRNDSVTFSDSWDISHSKTKLTCSVLIEIYDPKALEKIDFKAPPETNSDDGEVDFL